MTKVITYGTFDLFHVGHLRLLQRAKALAGADGALVVAVSSDRFNWEAKRKRCVVPDVQRMEIVRALRCVDRVIAEESWEQKRRDIVELGIDVFVMGDDWKGKFDFLSDLCEVRYLARTPDISSTDLKAEIRASAGLATSAPDTPCRYRGGVRPRCETRREARRFVRRVWRDSDSVFVLTFVASASARFEPARRRCFRRRVSRRTKGVSRKWSSRY